MTKLRSNSTPLRRASYALSLLAGLFTVAGCPSLHPLEECRGERTRLDGVCVANHVADYVSCVRAHGAELDAARHQEISADIGYIGAQVGGSAELGETLKKKYSSTDAATLKVVEACNAQLANRGGGYQPPQQSLVGSWTGMATEYGKSYSVSVQVTSLGVGRCAVIDYTSLGCTTILHCSQPSDGRALHGREQLIRGRGCVNGGRVTIAQQPNGTVSYLWKGDPRREVVTASLHPDMMP